MATVKYYPDRGNDICYGNVYDEDNDEVLMTPRWNMCLITLRLGFYFSSVQLPD